MKNRIRSRETFELELEEELQSEFYSRKLGIPYTKFVDECWIEYNNAWDETEAGI